MLRFRTLCVASLLCTTVVSAATLKCKAIDARATNTWCNDNCNHAGAKFCPSSYCRCTGASKTPISAPTPAPTPAKCSTDTTMCQCPSGPVNAYCTTDAQCAADGSYCMNDPAKVAPYVCHVPKKKLGMTVTLEGMAKSHFQENQKNVFKQAIFSGMKDYINTIGSIQIEDNKRRANTAIAITRGDAQPVWQQRRTASCVGKVCPGGSTATCTGSTGCCPYANTPSTGQCSCGTTWAKANGGGVKCGSASSTPDSRRRRTSNRRRKKNRTGCTSHPPAGQPAWTNCFGLSVQVQCEQADAMPFYCVWGYEPKKKLPTCKPCTSYAKLQMGFSRYCQDSAGKCWAKQDCTGVGTLCQVGKPIAIPTCCSQFCSNTTNTSSIPLIEPTNVTEHHNTSYSSASSAGSTTSVKFTVDLSNVAPSLYDQASSILNSHFGTSRRATSLFLLTAQAMASQQEVRFPVTSVSVDTSSKSYAQSYGTSGQGSSTSSNVGLIVGMVILCLVVVAAVAVGVYCFVCKHNEHNSEPSITVASDLGSKGKDQGTVPV